MASKADLTHTWIEAIGVKPTDPHAAKASSVIKALGKNLNPQFCVTCGAVRRIDRNTAHACSPAPQTGTAA